ncbi:pali-domain-containing protein [Leucogyrophana mollusca]|uniref:Pali-domain-containing protein n=1 Tax=Leucogyrophana mollusca TaxID=85980 RepID=A0ACB8BEA2_9AGAM|nr:pali-domain-containing protein [Leucogyrophana mollusca]
MALRAFKLTASRSPIPSMFSPIAALTPFMLFVAFILLFLVSLSVPIIKAIYLFRLAAQESSGTFDVSASGNVDFGVWGYCLSAVEVSVLGIDHNTAAHCSPIKLGFTFDSTIADALHASDIENALSRTLTAVLVLHPLACGFTFLALLVSLYTLYRGHSYTSGTGALPSRTISICALATTLLSAFLTILVFLIDAILVDVVRNKVYSDSDGALTLTWGNAVWMALGATIAVWIALMREEIRCTVNFKDTWDYSTITLQLPVALHRRFVEVRVVDSEDIHEGDKGPVKADFAALEEMRIEVWFDSAAIKLSTADGRRNLNGQEFPLTAAVVVPAAKGYESNPELRSMKALSRAVHTVL